jgi:hypothetical protein
MSPLARLLVSKQDNGLSFREMERKAYAKGHRYSSSAFEQVAKDARAGRLDIEAIKAIAAGTDEDVETIARLDDERWGIRHGEGEDDFRYQRPAGISDQEWEALRAEHKAHMDYLIDRAAKER